VTLRFKFLQDHLFTPL
jgi:hypothetical protein